jgi:GNAT superfamily N-acetyltransferase
MKLQIRKARKSDFENVFKLIIELAHFEKLQPPDKSAKNRLLRDSFGKSKINNILVAQFENEIVGYAFYFFTYSSFLARKTLYLEDIFISQNYRNKGIGKLLFSELVKTAKKDKCGRMEWCVLDWNVNAIKFYDKLGARPLGDWIYYRKLLKQ